MPTSIPNFTDDQVFTQMAGLQYWQSLTITYSFPINTTGLTANEGENPSFRPSNSAQQLLFALAIKTWDDLIRNNMVQTSSTSSDIELAYLTHADFFAHAYFPEDGTAWLNASYADLATPVFGQYGFLTMVHELGHTLGLNHMGDYDASRGDLPTPSSYQDSTVFSVMSYFGPGQGDNWPVAQADWIGSDNQTYYPQTPMLNDVMVIQRIYGASTTTRTGNTVYGFGSNLSGADATLYDFTLNRHPIMTLFDSGGVDTLNLSGWQTPSQIDLVAGHYSSVNAMSNNIAIAFGTVIENAVGGGGADRITGNAAANNLDGGVGNDTISGAEGDDTLTGGLGNDQIDGGAGDDLAVLAGSFASYTISYNANANSYTISGSASGTDSYTLVEHFQFSDVQLATGQLLKNDVTAPTLSTSSPADNAIGVAVGANLVLSFSETVVAGSGDIVIYTSAGSVARSIAIGDSSQVSIAGNVVTVNPAGDLAAGSAYYVNIGSGVLKDASGNAFAGISGSGAFNFSTAASADTTAPTLASSSPADNASAVAVNADLVLHFSESVQAGSGNILLYTSGGTLARTIAVTDSSQVSIAGSTVTINPASDLAGASAYYVNMAGGVFKDLAGNAYAGISGSTALNFGTAAALDTTAPVLLTSSPADEASSVAVGANLVLTFSETLQAGSGNILIYNSGGTLERTIAVGDTSQVSIAGSSVTINPSADLAAGASYYVNIASGVLRDVAGNAYAGLNGSGALNFSTAAAGADDYPWSTVTTGVVSVGGAPVGGSIEVRDDADLFRVSLSAGVSYVFNAARTSGGLADPYLQLYGPDVSVLAHDDDSGGSGNARISFTAAASGTYYLGVFDVGSGTGGYTVAAAIADSSAPTLVSSTPADNASAVTVGANLVLSFSEPVRAGSGSFLLYDANGSLAGSIAVGDTSQVSFSGSSVTINPAADLAPGASYYVNIASGVILDLAGNAYAGISGNSALNFSTAAAGGDDYPWSTSTTGVVTVGGAAASGVIEQIDDTDLFRVNLTAGLSYVFDLTRATGGLPDPFLLLFGTDQNNLAVDDDSGGSGNSRISFTAQTSGTYYLGVFDVGSGIGAYRLAAAVITGDTSAPTLISSTPADNATSVGAGADLVLNFSEAVRAGSGNILIYNANGSLARTIAITDSSQVSFSGSHLTLNPSADLDAGASYYLNLASGVVTDFSGNAFAGISGSSALNFSTVADDYPWSTSTGGLVTVGGAASTGVIEAAQDEDLFRVTLVAGTSYVFSLTRATGGLHDPYLELFDAGANALAHDDDSGGAGNARLSFTATSGGTYYLGVSDYASGIGAYSLSAVVLDTAAP
ncbi:MAG: Ig-like domain-containing protein, partial [Pseudomonadota bacterium]